MCDPVEHSEHCKRFVEYYTKLHEERCFRQHLTKLIDVTLEDQTMTDVKEYSTGELERLVALTEVTAMPGEFISTPRWGSLVFRLYNDLVASENGVTFQPGQTTGARRVRSFTDHTELDPPVAEMQAELERRKKPVISNETHGGRRCRTIIAPGLILRPESISGYRLPTPYYVDAVWIAYDDGSLGWSTPNGVELL